MARVSTWSFNPTPPTSIDYRPRLHSTGIDQAIKGFVKFVFLVFVVCVCVSAVLMFSRAACLWTTERKMKEDVVPTLTQDQITQSKCFYHQGQ